MRVRVRLDRRNARLWHAALLQRLSDRPDTVVEVEDARSLDPLPGSAETLFKLEAMIHGIPRPGPGSRAPDRQVVDRFPAPSGSVPDLVIDLGQGDAVADVPTWHILYDGAPGERALLGSLMAGRSPLCEIREGNRTVAAGRLGTEAKGVALASFDDALARTVILVIAALDGGAHAVSPLPDDGAARPAPVGSLDPAALGQRAAKQLARAIVRQLYRLCFHAPHWRVGWRRLDGPDLIGLGDHPAGGWTDLPDDGRRFYADPFPIVRDGRTTLFVEDFPHATGKGIISAAVVSPDGTIGTPEPVLECATHLSYPFVFERDGQCWMVPETGGAGCVELYRATRFPGGWVKEATLIDDVVASDATLLERDGRWWLFATVKDGGSFSDALHLWSAPDFRGLWVPHPANPVLIDIASARPAGRFVERDGALWRPVQDCRDGYGAALGLARVLRLDDAGFEQCVERILTAGPRWPGRRLHTLNSAGGFEFIDGSAPGPRKIFAGARR